MKGLLIFRRINFKIQLLILLVFTNLMSFSTVYLIEGIQTEINDSNISFNSSIVSLPQSIDNLLGTVSTWREGMIVEGTSLANDTNNNCFFVGTISFDFGSRFDIFLGKLNSTNDIEWINIITYNLIDRANDIELDVDQQKGFILGETTTSWSANSDCLISCFNLTNGNIFWNMTFGFSLLSEEGYSLVIVNDLLFITGVQTEVYQDYNTPDVFLACINSTNQTLLWMNSNFNDYYDCYPSLIYTEIFNELFLVYNRYEKNKMDYQFILQNFDLDGNISWSYSSDSSKYPKINDLLLLNSNQLLLVGDCYEEASTSFRDNYLVYFNFSSEEIREQTYGKQLRNEIITSLDFSNYYEIMICGYLESDINSMDIAFLANLNLDGTEIWSRESYEFYISQLNDIIILPDKRIITIGFAAYDFDFFYRRLLICGNLDNDRDSLSDYWEPSIGTDPNKADTDNDGYSDAEEYFASTDPLDPRSYPSRRISLRNFGVSIFILLIIGFIIIQIFFSFIKDERLQKKKSMSMRLIEFFRKLRKKT